MEQMFRLAKISWGSRAVVAAPLVSLFFALIPGSSLAQSEPIRVVSTIGMIGDLAEQVAGPCGVVTTLMGPGVDPHLYQATSGDVRDLDRAQLILYAGLSLEGQLGNVLAGFSQRKPTVAVADRAVPESMRIAPEEGYAYDPHVWMDAELWAQAVPVIASALAAAAPECQADIEARAARYQIEVQAMHDWIRAATLTIPASQRLLITAHDAFAYYGRAYGLELAAIQGISTQSEAAIADIRAVAERIADSRVPAVFLETTIHPRTIQAVIDAAGALGATVRLGGDLYGDALGDRSTLAGTYLGMMYVNTRTIVEALGGTLPGLPEELEAWRERRGLLEESR